jgi:hypothetical protein
MKKLGSEELEQRIAPSRAQVEGHAVTVASPPSLDAS